MNSGPIFRRELCSRMHSRRLRRERFRVALVVGLGFLVWAVFDWWMGGMRLARMVAGVPWMAVLPFILFTVGLSTGGRLLASEWREGTLPLLLLSGLTGHDIVLGKLLQALVAQAYLVLAAIPALVLPFLAAGFSPRAAGMVGLACLNIVFYGMTLRLLLSALGDGRRLKDWCVVLLAPLFLYSTPAGALVPAGVARDFLEAFQWLNPCKALAHASTAVGGFRPGAYWWPLLTSHAVAWGLAGVAGLVLSPSCRRQAGTNLGVPRRKWWRVWTAPLTRRSTAWRALMLERNPWEWRVSRENAATVHIWLWFGISIVLFGWLAWMARSAGLPVYYVLAMGAAAVWHTVLCAVVPGEASRRLVEDRQNGMLEVVLGTPLGVEEIVRGQWASLRRRYLAPMVTTMLFSTVLMLIGYVTSGFGGMLTADELGLWLFWWLANIIALPLLLVTLAWVAMRRTLVAQRAGDAAGVAVMLVHGIPVSVLVVLYWSSYLLGVRMGWWWAAGLLSGAYVATLAIMALHARRVFLEGLRQAAGGPSFSSSSEEQGSWLDGFSAIVRSAKRSMRQRSVLEK